VVLRLGLVGAVALLLMRLLGGVDARAVLDTLGGAAWPLVAVGALGNLVGTCGAAILRFHTLLGPLPHRGPAISLAATARLLYAAFAANLVLPARAGEALRTALLVQRHGYPLVGLVAVQLVEKVVELVVFGALAAGVLGVAALGGARHPPGFTAGLVGLVVAGAGVLVVALFAARRARARRGEDGQLAWPSPTEARHAEAEGAVAPASFGARVVAKARRAWTELGLGVGVGLKPAIGARVLVFTALATAFDVANLGLCLAGVGIAVPLSTLLLVFLAVNVSLIVPIAPGNLGVLEGAIVLVLAQSGVAEGTALGGALLYHAGQMLPVGLAGLCAFGLDLGARRRS
jgi:hypothetical protein